MQDCMQTQLGQEPGKVQLVQEPGQGQLARARAPKALVFTGTAPTGSEAASSGGAASMTLKGPSAGLWLPPHLGQQALLPASGAWP